MKKVEIHYTYVQTLTVEDKVELDVADEKALRNALTDAERHEILAPVIADHALESSPMGVHQRDIQWAVLIADA